jgi:hypothetical protein
MAGDQAIARDIEQQPRKQVGILGIGAHAPLLLTGSEQLLHSVERLLRDDRRMLGLEALALMRDLAGIDRVGQDRPQMPEAEWTSAPIPV